MITARAYGVYMYLHITRAQISAESLSKVFKEGREAIATALKELRDLGLIETKRQRIGARIVTVTTLVDTDYWAPETRLLLQQSQQNSSLLLNTYLLNYKQNGERGSQKEKEGETDMTFLGQIDSDPDDFAAMRAKDRARKREEKLQINQRRTDERMQKRNAMTPKDWSVTDSTFEFANRVMNLFTIPPWHVAKSRFRFALSNKRSEFGTDGEIESRMMDLFFEQYASDATLKTGEDMWKRFIVQFENLYKRVSIATYSQDEVESEKEKATKSLEWLD